MAFTTENLLYRKVLFFVSKIFKIYRKALVDALMRFKRFSATLLSSMCSSLLYNIWNCHGQKRFIMSFRLYLRFNPFRFMTLLVFLDGWN
jgi:hypothetical protein